MKKIGFIGVGVMGRSMVTNLMKKGFEVYVYTRTKEKAQPVLDAGAKWCGSVAECARGRDAVITIVGFPEDVREVYFGKDGILENAQKGCCIIDMTTTVPALAVEIYHKAKSLGLFALDAPVSGGDLGARAGTMTIMVGGDREIYDRCMGIFEAMGSCIVYQGGPGCGQHTKAANQIAIAGAIAGVAEAIAYGKKAGLDPVRMLESISKGSAASTQMQSFAPKMISRDYAPGFYIKHFVKDLKIADDESKKVGLTLSVMEQVLEIYKQVEADGMGDCGTQAIIEYFR